MIDKLLSVKYWSAQKDLRLWSLWFCERGSSKLSVMIVESTSFCLLPFVLFTLSLSSMTYFQVLQIAYTHSWFGVNVCADTHNDESDPQYTNETKMKTEKF